jgi:hypothetical protein
MHRLRKQSKMKLRQDEDESCLASGVGVKRRDRMSSYEGWTKVEGLTNSCCGVSLVRRGGLAGRAEKGAHTHTPHTTQQRQIGLDRG